ncbi:MAG: leucine-rich repeat domain-containing protein [Oscillospiraceae bacterium]|nr:leucine-rich repeat domain-containing protein [Oscillospiraceae bacterium]
MNQDFEIKDGVVIKYLGKGGAVTVPDGVTKIGDRAFFACETLTSVNIPESVTSIGYEAFHMCTSLTEVRISGNVKNLGSYVFAGTPWLMEYPDDFVTINGTLLEYKGKDNAVIIPDGITCIGWGAFYNCENMISVKLPASLTSISGSAFSVCTGLTSVVIPDGVTSIGQSAFYGCENLVSVMLPDTVTEIGRAAFYACPKLKHAPLLVADGKLLYEPPWRNGVSFSEIRQLVQEKDYAMRMNREVKYHLLLQMFALGIDQERVSDYLKKRFSAVFPVLIAMNDREIVQKILDSEKFVTKRNIDKMIQYAIAQQNYQIQLLLTEYKQKKGWYQEIGKALKL